MLKSVKEKVEWVLRNCPETRENDITLIFKVLQEFYGITEETYFKDVINKICVGDLPAFESIRRTRQKFQETGKYLPEKPVVEARKQLKVSVEDQLKFWERL